jgi:hypothetical protein
VANEADKPDLLSDFPNADILAGKHGTQAIDLQM